MMFRRVRYPALWLLLAAAAPCMARAPIPKLSADPYRGAIVVDGGTGATIFEDNADAQAYPASIVKLMDMLIVLDAVDRGALRRADTVRVSANAAGMGGSQVYLKEGETFTVEELLYALVIQSANDAAVALAEHMAGTREAFVDLMNRWASRLGMTATEFHSVHGLPPGTGQKPDLSTARDIALLARELITRHPGALRYTSTVVKGFRNDTFEMRSHNHLLEAVPGCDGLKTGYFAAGGFSIAATAERNGRRVIAVVMGSTGRAARDARATELLSQGFLELSAAPRPAAPQEAGAASNKKEPAPAGETADAPGEKRGILKIVVISLVVAALFAAGWIRTSRRIRRYNRLR